MKSRGEIPLQVREHRQMSDLPSIPKVCHSNAYHSIAQQLHDVVVNVFHSRDLENSCSLHATFRSSREYRTPEFECRLNLTSSNLGPESWWDLLSTSWGDYRVLQ